MLLFQFKPHAVTLYSVIYLFVLTLQFATSIPYLLTILASGIKSPRRKHAMFIPHSFEHP